jgi:hypothetical protein
MKLLFALLLLTSCTEDTQYKCQNGRLYTKTEDYAAWIRTSRGCMPVEEGVHERPIP